VDEPSRLGGECGWDDPRHVAGVPEDEDADFPVGTDDLGDGLCCLRVAGPVPANVKYVPSF
jgi:hypothetical protein